MYVRAIVRVTPCSSSIGLRDVEALGRLVEQRCPVAAIMAKAGVKMEFNWTLNRDDHAVSGS